METLDLCLEDGRTLSGLAYIPPTSQKKCFKGLPLIICVPGGANSADYSINDTKYSINHTAKLLDIPIVAINRPGYKQTTALPSPLKKRDDSHFQNEARWLHRIALPAIWREVGHRENATSIVLFCHNIGTTIGVITAALHAIEARNTQSYPLSGLILSGLGTKVRQLPQLDLKSGPHSDADGNPLSLMWPREAKDELLLNVSEGLAPPGAIEAHHKFNEPAFISEAVDGNDPSLWAAYWRDYACQVSVPVMTALGEADRMWEATEEVVNELASAFERAPRKDFELIKRGSHSLDLSWYSQAWYAKCCGFAMMCAVEHELVRGTKIG